MMDRSDVSEHCSVLWTRLYWIRPFKVINLSLISDLQVLLQVTLDIPNQAFLLFILDQIHSRWTDGQKASPSSLTFLGKLLDAHPALSQTLTSSRSLLVSDEDVKVSVCYVLFRIWSFSAAVQMLPDTHRQRMCVLLLHTLSNTHTTALTVNCLGVEPLVRCLKDTLGKSNTEVQKQGLKLLAAILDRQPAAVRLFPTGSEFSAVCDVIVEGVSSSCLQVSMCAVRAATVLFRPNHQSSPVQLTDIKRIMEVVMSKITEHHHTRSRESCSASDSVTARVLLQTLTCFDAACRPKKPLAYKVKGSALALMTCIIMSSSESNGSQ
ncbi:meiosis inhibitor 1 isoform X1 [Labeo rohita]|uniref:Meiosis inhibitor 1 isoform X1 n=1 Tax=Labeo rohita TaxID=84645 RepID=A0A498NW32_LABRO|nr:meiosis inhibitor 1 isoform X1 [Labeo rohita]